MQFSYQFPERCERLVLVDSGGLGRDVSLLLRAATLPGSELVLPLLAATRLLDAGRLAGGLLGRVGLRAGTDFEEMARGHATLADPEARAAFLHTLRAVVEPGGQRVDASNRLYLARQFPLLLVWGERDSIIPVAHGRAAHEQLPAAAWRSSRTRGTSPSSTSPSGSLEVLIDFIEIDRAGRRVARRDAGCSEPARRGSAAAHVEHDLAGRATLVEQPQRVRRRAPAGSARRRSGG